jgi:two-component system sensor histidine kinase TctE
VVGDRLMLAELINNLIENAILYTPPGGNITVRVGGDALTTYLEVHDSGPGIPPEQQLRVFERFYRVLGTDTDGSGLGLSIVKEIADLHKAGIAFMPSGKGTCLRISFSRIDDLKQQRELIQHA